MSEGIPKSVRELLAKQAAGDSTFPPQWGGNAHPSSDLLNAYAEQCLSEEESRLVVAHLADCAVCREIVFVATRAAEEELQQTPAKAPMLRLQSVRQLQMPQNGLRSVRDELPNPQPEPPPPQPAPQRHWWKWAVPAVAALILVGVGILERDQIGNMRSPAPETAASVQRPATPEAKDTASASMNSRSQKNQAQQKSPAANELDRVESGSATDKNEMAVSRRADKSLDSTPTGALQAEPSAPRAVGNLAADERPATTAKAAPPPPRQAIDISSAAPSANAPNGGNDLSYISPELKQQALANSAMAGGVPSGAMVTVQKNRAAPTRWRVSSDGHLEHTVGPSTWERVMSAEPVTFHAVTTVGSNVWAGGTDGALYYSSDNGREWNRVALAGEQGAIKAIHFSNSRQGSLTTDAGTVWTTADGGTTWSKQ